MSESNLENSLISQCLVDFKSAGLRCDRGFLSRFVSALLTKRFLILTGLAGSGKTKLAQAFARWMCIDSQTGADPFVVGASIPSGRISYIVRNADSLSVEFWNDEDENRATKVTLPRKLIQEWVDYIAANNISESTSARPIREGVSKTTKFSTQLNSFETHLKAAAFALLRAPRQSLDFGQVEIVSVGADWIGKENVLGYPNGLDAGAYVSTPALDLILRAKARRDLPHFLILDEMNLSHVERYFADFLSAIESGEQIALHGDDARHSNGNAIPGKIHLPDNLFIVGTVNVDETTYMFSPKVLDRANVIEFRMNSGELKSFLADPRKPDVNCLGGQGAKFAACVPELARQTVSLSKEWAELFEEEMLVFFEVMHPHGAEFGYRVAHEAARFVHFFGSLEKLPMNELGFRKAFDCVVVQKFLPKLHGSRAKLGPLLKTLWFLCASPSLLREQDSIAAAHAAAHSTEKTAEPGASVPENAAYPLSAQKIARMWRLLNENGFASFAEA